MSELIVLDASALLAVLNDESGAEAVRAALSVSIISTVNLAEVYSKAAERGLDRVRVRRTVDLVREAVPFTESQAELCGQLRLQTKAAGLSLADRACLALAIEQHAEVLTADRDWATLELPCLVHLIR